MVIGSVMSSPNANCSGAASNAVRQVVLMANATKGMELKRSTLCLDGQGANEVSANPVQWNGRFCFFLRKLSMFTRPYFLILFPLCAEPGVGSNAFSSQIGH